MTLSILSLNTQNLSNEGAWMHIVNPVTEELLYATEGKPIRVKVLGEDGEKYKKITSKMRQDVFGAARSNKVSLDKTETLLKRMTAKSVVDWEGFYDDKGDGLEFSEENVLKIFDALPWLQDQVDNFRRDRANFIKVMEIQSA